MLAIKKYSVGVLVIFMLVGLCTAQESISNLKIDVKEFTLDNGMLFLIVERHSTPQVACKVAVRSGSAHEESGKTGVAHMLEHMLFKGTKNFGSLDYTRDEALQQQIENAYQTVLEEQQKRHPDNSLIKSKRAEMDNLRTQVQNIYIPQAFSSQLSKNGSININASTTQDQTRYYLSVPSDMIEQWFSIASEQIFEPAWREFYVEKEVIEREWAYRYVNSPGGAAWFDLYATAFTAHPYRNPVIGWKADIDKFNTTDAIAFHKKFYTPSNSVCVLVGDITAERAQQFAETYFSRYPSGKRSTETVTLEPEQQGPRKSIRFLKGARTPLIRIGYHGARMGTDDFYAIDVMTMILSHGRSARMTQNITNKGLAVSAWAYNPDNRYGGLIFLGGSPNEPGFVKKKGLTEDEKRKLYISDCEALEDLLTGEIDKMKTQLVSKNDLERIKKLNRRGFLDRMRSNEDLAGMLADLEIEVGWRYLNSYLKKLAEITPEDIKRVANTYFRTENKTTAYVIPGGKPEQPPQRYTENRSVSTTAAAKLSAPDTFENHSIYPTPEKWKHPLSFSRSPQKINYTKAKKTRSGKTIVFFLPDRELPLIDLAILVKAGSVDIHESQTGLTGLMNRSLIRGGTDKHSPSRLARLIDENAIQLSISVGEESSVINLSVIKEDWEKGLALLQEIITQPAFDSKIFEAVKKQMLTSLKREGGDAQTVAMREGSIWHFKGHPYGRDPLIGLKTIPNLTQKDLKHFLHTYFVPSNMVIAVSGDISKKRAVSGLKNFFKTLPQKNAPVRHLSEPKKTSPVLALIHKPGQVQSQIIFRLRGLKRTHPDYWKMRLLTELFGGDDSLMYKRLRDDLGLVYSAGFVQSYKWNAGILLGYIGCKADTTATALSETVTIMKSLRNDIPEKDLELKRLDALNSFVFNVDTPFQLVQVYSRYHMRKEPLNTLEKIQDAYLSATKKELQKLAIQLLDPSKLQIIIVADKTTPVLDNGSRITLEQNLKKLAEDLGLPFQEIALR